MQTLEPPTSPEARVTALVEEVLADTDLYLVEVQVRGQKGSRVVNIFVDSDGGIGIDDLAEVSREVSFLLDAEDVIDGRYNLNVSSPGVERPLLLPRQFRKNVGRTLKVTLQAAEGEKPVVLVGDLVGADETGIVLDVSRKRQEEIPYAAIAEARVQLPW